MSDGIVLMELGQPVVVIVQSVFEQAARTQATLLGGPGLPVCAYAAPVPGEAPDADAVRARDIAERVAALLVHGQED